MSKTVSASSFQSDPQSGRHPRNFRPVRKDQLDTSDEYIAYCESRFPELFGDSTYGDALEHSVAHLIGGRA